MGGVSWNPCRCQGQVLRLYVAALMGGVSWNGRYGIIVIGLVVATHMGGVSWNPLHLTEEICPVLVATHMGGVSWNTFNINVLPGLISRHPYGWRELKYAT